MTEQGPGSPQQPSRDSQEPVDVLAQRALVRQRRRAWESGETQAPGWITDHEKKVAPWDLRRERDRALQLDEDPDERGPGLARGRDRPGPTPYDPRTGREELHRIVTGHGWVDRLAVAWTVSQWSGIVGEQVAQHCTVESFNADQVTVRASSSSWAQQLRLLQPTIEARVAETMKSAPAGTMDVRSHPGQTRPRPPVTLRILGPAAPSWRHRGVGLHGARGPRDTYG
ncbi:DUF721 domain-containing protein [Actinomyces sp. 2119]|uniref:DUF721 domain-containing protein n=1 Tax=Actinomyces lilanjuaniae TaxID=2321394 RepID=A0ABN5PPB8_9ACTO|nr:MULTISPECIES: DciA family protein [Actinomyces]AYD88849.1 DUF721 domain-containing protein [Actinomyces lilanjuaniae]RJF43846.1 DUF721 domain-containing protein [Actinomyces sp. 2119]